MGDTRSRARAFNGMRGLAALIATLSSPAVAQPVAAPVAAVMATGSNIAADGQTEDFLIGNSDQRMTVLVSVGGKGPFPFVIDTGAERTVMSRQLADRLKLTEAAKMTVHGVANSTVVRAVRVPRLEIGSSSVTVEQSPLFEARNIGAAGLLGVDALSRQRVLIDFKTERMSVSPSSDPIEQTDGQTIVVRALSYHGRLMFKHAMAGNRRTLMVIDTGSQYTIGNMELLAKLGRHVKLDPTPVLIETVTGHSVVAHIGKVDTLTIDEVQLTDIYVAFAAASGFKALGLDGKPALLLGMNVMRAFERVSIDFAKRRVRFTFPRKDSSNAFELASKERPTRYLVR